MLESEKHCPFRGCFFLYSLPNSLCCAWASFCLHYLPHFQLYQAFRPLFFPFNLESSFGRHSRSYLPSLPHSFVCSVHFHTLLLSYKIRVSIWFIIWGIQVSKTWNKTIKCGTAFPEGSDYMHVHTAAWASWPSRRDSEETCHVLEVLASLYEVTQGQAWTFTSGFPWSSFYRRPYPQMARMLIWYDLSDLHCQ